MSITVVPEGTKDFVQKGLVGLCTRKDCITMARLVPEGLSDFVPPGLSDFLEKNSMMIASFVPEGLHDGSQA